MGRVDLCSGVREWNEMGNGCTRSVENVNYIETIGAQGSGSGTEYTTDEHNEEKSVEKGARSNN